MTAKKQCLLLVPLLSGTLALAAACGSSSAPAPAAQTSNQSRPLAATVAATVAAAAAAATAVTASVPPVTVSSTAASSAAAAQAPTKIASALAAASAIVGGANPAAAKIDPCMLLSREAAEAGAGVSLSELRQKSDVTGPSCEYSSATGPESVTVSALASGGRSAYDGVAAVYSNRVDVPGLGDKAFIVKGLGLIAVLKGDTLLTVQMVNLKLSGDQTAAALTTMAKTALSHL